MLVKEILAIAGQIDFAHVHLFLSSFALQVDEKQIINVSFYVECGVVPTLRALCKTHISPQDDWSAYGEAFTHVGVKPRPEMGYRVHYPDGGTFDISNQTVFEIKLATGACYTQKIEICLDFRRGHSAQLLQEQLSNAGENLIPKQIDLIVSSNQISLLQGPLLEMDIAAVSHIDPARRAWPERKRDVEKAPIFGPAYCVDVMVKQLSTIRQYKALSLWEAHNRIVARKRHQALLAGTVPDAKVEALIDRMEALQAWYEHCKCVWLKDKAWCFVEKLRQIMAMIATGRAVLDEELIKERCARLQTDPIAQSILQTATTVIPAGLEGLCQYFLDCLEEGIRAKEERYSLLCALQVQLYEVTTEVEWIAHLRKVQALFTARDLSLGEIEIYAELLRHFLSEKTTAVLRPDACSAPFWSASSGPDEKAVAPEFGSV